MANEKIIENWISNSLEPDVEIKELEGSVICPIEISENMIVGGFDNGILKVFTYTGELISTLSRHEENISMVKIFKEKVISCSSDNTVKIWNSDTGHCIHTLEGHTGSVWCMDLLCDDQLASGSFDHTIRVWNIDSGKCLHELSGHQGGILCILYKNNNTIISSSCDKTIKIWNLTEENCVQSLNGHTAEVCCLQLNGDILVSGSWDNSIKVWNVNSGICKDTLMTHKKDVIMLKLHKSKIVSGSLDGTAKMWNIKTGKSTAVSEYKGHKMAITGLEYIYKFFITSSEDGTVKLWNIHTGKFIRNLVTAERGESSVMSMKASNSKLVCSIHENKATIKQKNKIVVFDLSVKKEI